MSSWQFRRDSKERGLCLVCNEKFQKSNGQGGWKPLCSACDKERYRDPTKPRIAPRTPRVEYRKEYCEGCGFKPIHICQLDLDHIDGNHNNNELSNLQTLCANCHRYKTWLNKDNVK